MGAKFSEDTQRQHQLRTAAKAEDDTHLESSPKRRCATFVQRSVQFFENASVSR